MTTDVTVLQNTVVAVTPLVPSRHAGLAGLSFWMNPRLALVFRCVRRFWGRPLCHSAPGGPMYGRLQKAVDR
ncbi:MAG: hypothetical protein ACLRWL_05570 [Evtepia gabavorous]